MKLSRKMSTSFIIAGLLGWNTAFALQDDYDAVASEGINIQQYLDSEFYADGISAGKTNDNYLDAINAEYAWARGFTGLGSKIVIIDSGINMGHDEFAGSITDTKSFLRRSRTGITDRVGHGSGLASIAAGNRDGVGVVGVAFDADIAVAKVTDNKRIGFSQVRNAVTWAGDIGADVANISANGSYSRTYKRNWKQTSDGAWYNDHKRYVKNFYNGRRSTGFYGGESPDRWAKALNGNTDLVIVNSAGNGGLAFPMNPAPMAYATNDDGSLALNGQMLVVGAYDLNSNNIARYSNRAGHLCQGKNLDMKGGTCADEYRMSDFYIMAPGNAFTASKKGDLYNLQTGTSQAAAVVSGAVAVVKQAWPHMTAAETVTLLTTTASKDIDGYNPDVHGSGLLDLEKATRPVGALGLPTSSSRYDSKVALGGAFVGVSAALDGDGLSQVMVTDELGRDYYVDLATTAQTKKRRSVEFNPITKANFYGEYNPYNQFNNYTKSNKVSFAMDRNETTFMDMKMDFNEETQVANFEMGHTTKLTNNANYRIGFGVMNEKNAFMGNYMSGMFGSVDQSVTNYMNIGGNYALNDRVTAFGNFYTGYTDTGMETTGIITDVSGTQSYSWSAGFDVKTTKASSVGFTLSQPVTIATGSVDVTLPMGLDAKGNTVFETERVSLAPSVQEYDFGAYYKFADNVSLVEGSKVKAGFTAYAEHQMNYLNQSDVKNNVAGFLATFTF